jgi:hypothetical protein
MTPKEKAKELFDKYDFDHNEFDYSKEYALIAVDEIINEYFDKCLFSKCDYWNEVKKEIELL